MTGIYVDTMYSLFIFLLIEDSNNRIYFLEESFANAINKKELLKNGNIFIIRNKYKKRRIIGLLENLYNNFNIYKKLKNINLNKFYIQDHLMYGDLMLNNVKSEVVVLEDGTKNYNYKILEDEVHKKRTIKFCIKKIIRDVLTLNIFFNKKEHLKFGFSPKVSKVFLTGILPIPEQIKDKVEIVDLREKWSNLTKERQEEILNTFNIDKKEIEMLSQDKEKILLLTQPLSEDGYISEKEKIEIYKEILVKRNIKKIYIKVHPREATDYSKAFGNEIKVISISKEFPVELLPLLGISFDKSITIFSTAAFFFKNYGKVEFIGTKEYPSLCKIFGEIKEV